MATASDRAGIAGANQSLSTYLEVLNVRKIAFGEWVEVNYPEMTHMDECDWDDQYEAWLELDSGF